MKKAESKTKKVTKPKSVKSDKKAIKKEVVTGYKVFNSDWKCHGFQYEVGKTYKHDGSIELCSQGFHFCLDLNDCFEYYSFNPDNKIAMVETSGKVIHGNDKSVCNEITIVKEISWSDMLNIVNTGKNNTGRKNSGDSNTGDRNTGDSNTGNSNTGYSNTGDRNTGYSNTGNSNTGNSNTGNRNTGYRNTGDFNSGNYSSGIFSTEEEPKIKIFDVESTWTMKEWRNSKAFRILSNIEFTEWVWFNSMTDEEKKDNPKAETTGGYNRVTDYKEAWITFWNNLNDENKKEVMSLPNFCPIKFKEITGVDV